MAPMGRKLETKESLVVIHGSFATLSNSVMEVGVGGHSE